eukprot:33633-Prymnesium_polylepis.1
MATWRDGTGGGTRETEGLGSPHTLPARWGLPSHPTREMGVALTPYPRDGRGPHTLPARWGLPSHPTREMGAALTPYPRDGGCPRTLPAR